MDEIEGIDYTLDPLPMPAPDLDGWILVHPRGGRFECALVDYEDGPVWAWITLRRKPDRDY